METVRYIDSEGTSVTLTAAGRYLGGNVDTWEVTPVFDTLAGDLGRFSGYALEPREWELHFAISAADYAAARAALAAWRGAIMGDVSRGKCGTIEIDHGGVTYAIDAAAATPDVDGPHGGYIDVTLRFHSKSPFWVAGDQVEVNSSFSGSTPVSVAWTNAGDVYAYPVHVITGALQVPRISDDTSGDYIKLNTGWAGATDQVWIWTDEPLVRYYVGGTGAGDREKGKNWTKYAGTSSTFFQLPVGSGTLTLTATSGTATYSLRYYIRVAGLR